MKIDPSTTSTNLDYGHNSDDGSNEDRQNKQQNSDEYQPILPHDDVEPARSKKLTSRKARKKKRKIAERKARQKNDEDQEEL